MAHDRRDDGFNSLVTGALGEDVRQVREARKITQRALAHAVGYSVSYVSQVEAGKIVPSERFVQGCDKVFGTGDLFTRQRHRLVHGEHPSWFVPQVQAEGRATVVEDFSTVCCRHRDTRERLWRWAYPQRTQAGWTPNSQDV